MRWLIVVGFAIAACAHGPSRPDAPPKALLTWADKHPLAAQELCTWERDHPQEAIRLAHWVRDEPVHAMDALQFAATHALRRRWIRPGTGMFRCPAIRRSRTCSRGPRGTRTQPRRSSPPRWSGPPSTWGASRGRTKCGFAATLERKHSPAGYEMCPVAAARRRGAECCVHYGVSRFFGS